MMMMMMMIAIGGGGINMAKNVVYSLMISVCFDVDDSGRSAERSGLVGTVGSHVPTKLRRGPNAYMAVLRQRYRISTQLSRYSKKNSKGHVRTVPRNMPVKFEVRSLKRFETISI